MWRQVYYSRYTTADILQRICYGSKCIYIYIYWSFLPPNLTTPFQDLDSVFRWAAPKWYVSISCLCTNGSFVHFMLLLTVMLQGPPLWHPPSAEACSCSDKHQLESRCFCRGVCVRLLSGHKRSKCCENDWHSNISIVCVRSASGHKRYNLQGYLNMILKCSKDFL